MSEKPENVIPPAEADQKVDQIREILFGTHMREYEQRFSELEKRLVAENEKMGEFLEKRLTGIATATQRELSGLAMQIEEQNERLKGMQDESRRELEGVNSSMGDRLSGLEDLLSKENKALRNDLTEHYNELVDLVKKTRKKLSQSLEDESNALQDAKVAREDLATMLFELAGRLKDGGDRAAD